MKLFAQITKVDEAKREVIGRAVQEVPDRADEIFDYASSKPYFEEWSKSFADDTDGKSLGNLRAMHGKVAAGKLTGIDFNDTDKAIDIRAKIVDQNEWAKVLEGVYTGFSIGGSYVGDKTTEKVDGRDIKRYTARPSEISIVDSPCIPTAKFFEIVKADGAVAKVDFKVATKPEEPTPIEVTGTDEQVAQFAKLLNDSELTLGEAIDAIQAIATAREAAKADAVMLDTIAAMEKREFSADERKAAAKEGAALPDGSFPIKTVQDLENAVHAYGRAKDKAAAKAHIIKRAKALGATDKLPKGWIEGEKAAGGDLAKGMWNVQDFACALQTIAQIAASAQYDLEVEGDDSPIPMQLRNWVSEGVAIFKAMAAEESEELVADLKTRAGVGEDDEIEAALEMARKLGDLRKRLDDPALTVADAEKIAAEYEEPLGKDFAKRVLAKAGKRHSAADMKRLQDAHDNLVAMGADCGTGKVAPADGVAKSTDTATQLAAALERIAKLEAQPMQFVTLRTVAVPREKDGQQAPAEKQDPDDMTGIPLEPQDYVLNSDGSIDYFASRLMKAQKLARA